MVTAGDLCRSAGDRPWCGRRRRQAGHINCTLVPQAAIASGSGPVPEIGQVPPPHSPATPLAVDCWVSGQIAAIYVGNYRINLATTTGPLAHTAPEDIAGTRQTLKSICSLINCPRIFIKLKE